MAKSIAEILSNGYFENLPTVDKYTRNLEFTYRMGNNNDVRVVMTAVRGHLMGVDFEPNYKSWYACSPVDLYHLPTVKTTSADLLKVEQNLKEQARIADQVMIWTDCDREGENIGAEVASVCQGVNRRITVTRARFSSVTPNEIHRAMRNPVFIDYNQANAVDARQEVDLRIGSCQFPTLGFIVDQYRKVENFVPESFWKIELKHCKNSLDAVFSWHRVHLFDQLICLVIYESLLEPNNAPVAKITKVASQPTKKWRPLPLTTVELQKNGSRYLSISSDQVMKAAESLYTKGWISYPRTETDQFDSNYDLMALVRKQTESTVWGQFAQGLVDGGYRVPRKGKNNDQAHPPIHPVTHTSALEGNEKKVYEFVVRRFLACCADDAKGDQTNIEAQIKEETFSTTGLVIKERNYLDVYPYDKWTGNVLPEFVVGEEFTPTELTMKAGATTAPKLLTESQLIAIMDKNGIGTDATIAEHIKTITDRNYVVRSKVDREYVFTPSTLGIGLVEGYDNIGLEMSLSKPYLRAQLEANLKLICDGVKTKEDVVQEAIQSYRQVFEKVIRERMVLQQALENHVGRPQQPPPGQGGLGGGGGGGNGDDGNGRGDNGGPGGRARPFQPQPFVNTGISTKGNNQGSGTDAQDGPEVFCNCQPPLPAVERTVTKEGDNKGRKFLTCSQPRDQQCGFFKFSDEIHNGARVGSGTNHDLGSSNTNSGNMYKNSFQGASASIMEAFHDNLRLQQQSDEVQPRCHCGYVAKKLESKKSGTNREYWKCSKTSAPCKYFKWDDEWDHNETPTTGWSANANTGRNGTNSGNSSIYKAESTCYKCNKKGHFANECKDQGASTSQRGFGIKTRGKSTAAKRTAGGSSSRSNVVAVKVSRKPKPI
ncbi:DNA topoisomerase [Podila epigama]|nr:DNA topoisomerase [Podila epigama]